MRSNRKKAVLVIQKAHNDLITTYSEKELKVVQAFLEGFTRNVTEPTEKLEITNYFYLYTL